MYVKIFLAVLKPKDICPWACHEGIREGVVVAPFILIFFTKYRWVVSLRLHFYLWGIGPHYSWRRRPDDSLNFSFRFGAQKNLVLLLGPETQYFRLSSRGTVIIPTLLFLFLFDRRHKHWRSNDWRFLCVQLFNFSPARICVYNYFLLFYSLIALNMCSPLSFVLLIQMCV